MTDHLHTTTAMNSHVERLEIQKVDYQAAYAALARRVAAAYAFQISHHPNESLKELEAAIQVIEAVENPIAFINPS